MLLFERVPSGFDPPWIESPEFTANDSRLLRMPTPGLLGLRLLQSESVLAHEGDVVELTTTDGQSFRVYLRPPTTSLPHPVWFESYDSNGSFVDGPSMAGYLPGGRRIWFYPSGSPGLLVYVLASEPLVFSSEDPRALRALYESR